LKRRTLNYTHLMLPRYRINDRIRNPAKAKSLCPTQFFNPTRVEIGQK